MTDRTDLAARLRERAGRAGVLANDGTPVLYGPADAALDREAADALSRPVQKETDDAQHCDRRLVGMADFHDGGRPLGGNSDPVDLARLVTEQRGIYTASKTKHAEKWRRLRSCGLPVISTWIDEAGEGESADLADLWIRCVREASSCQVLIVYREPDDMLKGAWIEMGAALAVGIPVLAVGIREYTVANHPGIEHFDGIVSAVARARAILAAAIGTPAPGPETYPGHDPAAGLPQPDTAGGAVSLAECPVGLFVPVARPEALCLKTEYRSNGGRIDAYIVSSGEFFWGDHPQTIANQRRQMVIPFDIATREAAIRAEATAKERERCAERMNAAYSEWWRLGNEHGERFAAWKRGGEEGPMPESRLGSLPDYLAAAIRGGSHD